MRSPSSITRPEGSNVTPDNDEDVPVFVGSSHGGFRREERPSTPSLFVALGYQRVWIRKEYKGYGRFREKGTLVLGVFRLLGLRLSPFRGIGLFGGVCFGSCIGLPLGP